MPNSSNKQKTSINRPPVVVVMGHIDHGKSTLLDYIRKTDIVSGEAGGITQHVGAYQVEHTTAEGKKSMITFLDTPGHEAFCSIRERGAQAADIAILVVSAEDGVKPQTMEAYKNIKDQNIPYVVAISKIDKPNADVNKAKQSLSEHEIYVEGWGGDIPCVPISATKGTGVSELLDMVMLVAEIGDFKTDPKASAEGIVIESERRRQSGHFRHTPHKERDIKHRFIRRRRRSVCPGKIHRGFQRQEDTGGHGRNACRSHGLERNTRMRAVVQNHWFKERGGEDN